MSLGLFGLVGAWRRAAAHGWTLAQGVGDLMLWPVTAIWTLSLLLYAFKCKRHPQAVLRESRHPVQGSLQALAPLSMLLATVQLHRPGQGVWLVLAVLALGLLGFIAWRVLSALATGRMPANAVTPALYLPLVGTGLVGGMAMASLDHAGLAAVLFGSGIAGWALLEARVLNRLFDGPLPEALRPTIGVELAPPVVATLSAAIVWPALPGDGLAIGLGAAIIPFAAVAARYAWWSAAPFSLGFWSFSFPLSSLAAATIEVTHRSGWPQWIGIGVLLAASAAIAWLALRTLILLLQGRLLPVE
jgi:tellurite resistance protein